MTTPTRPPKRVRPKTVEFRGYTFPQEVGDCADMLYQLREERALANKMAEEVDAKFRALQEYVIEQLPKSNASGVAGQKARVQVTTKKVPQVADWAMLYSYIESNHAFDLMQRRVNEAAVKERWDNGQSVPGVESFTAVKLSITRI